MNVAPPLMAHSASSDDTRALGARLAGLVQSGDVLLLGGDLGAGKTTFTQGLASGLGVTEQVTSPTFTLLRTYYGGRVPLVHADLYRLEQIHEILDLGLPEMLDDGAAAAIEWGESAARVLLPDYLHIRIEFGDHEEGRTVRLRPVGARWTARQSALAQVVAAGASASGAVT